MPGSISGTARLGSTIKFLNLKLFLFYIYFSSITVSAQRGFEIILKRDIDNLEITNEELVSLNTAQIQLGTNPSKTWGKWKSGWSLWQLLISHLMKKLLVCHVFWKMSHARSSSFSHFQTKAHPQWCECLEECVWQQIMWHLIFVILA